MRIDEILTATANTETTTKYPSTSSASKNFNSSTIKNLDTLGNCHFLPFLNVINRTTL